MKLAGMDCLPPSYENKGNPCVKQTINLWHGKTFFLMFLILFCGNISLNPGPNYKYPCGTYEKAVRKNQTGILCDGCNLWFHTKSLDMPSNVYFELVENSQLDWHCHKCTLPQFSDSFSDTSSCRSSRDSAAAEESSAGEEADTYFRKLTELKSKHSKNIIFAHVNINSFRYKYKAFHGILYEKATDVVVITETKLDDSFPDAQFQVDGYTMYRKDRDSNGGGVIFYIRNDVPSRQRNDLEFTDIKNIAIEISIGKDKWLVLGAYKPPSMKSDIFSLDFQKSMDKIYLTYEIFFYSEISTWISQT